jgi:arylsulfatase
MRALPLLLLALCASAGCGGERTRIVLITLDSLRYDSFAGSAERVSSMPRTSALAAKGTRFEHFYASTSSAQPTQATIFTGLHPWNHGVTRNGVVLEEAHRTFPERLRRAGFATAAVVGSFELHRSFGYAQGFDQFHDQLEIDIEGRHSFHDVPLGDNGFYSLADSVTRTALEVLDGLRGERQFVWVHYFDPHGPYGDAAGLAESLSTPRLLSMVESGHPEIREALREAHRLYERDVASLDEALSRLLQRLLEDAEQVTTHVLVASNHGESFGEAGSIGHDTRLTREQIHVPCFVLSPAIEPGRRADVAGSIDLASTILALAGLGQAGLSGRDLARRPGGGRGFAFGMRQTYEQRRLRPNLSGRPEVLTGNRFYAVVDRVIFAGDRQGVAASDASEAVVAPAISEALKQLFAHFETELEGWPAELAGYDASLTRSALKTESGSVEITYGSTPRLWVQ